MRTPHFFWLLATSLFVVGCNDHSSRSIVPTVTPLVLDFEARVDVGTGAAKHADGVLADFTGDTVPDMVVVNLTGEVELLVGQGDGTFASTLMLTPGGRPVAVAAADLDGDNDRDLVVLRSDAELATVYLNDGMGGLSVHVELPLGSDAVALVLGDHDGDNIADIVVARLATSDLVVYTGTGGGNFIGAASVSMPGGGSPLGLALGEVSGDALNDLVVCDSAGDRVLVYPGTALGLDPNPADLPIQGQPIAASIGDLNDDGSNDIAVSALDAERVSVITSWSMSGSTAGFSVDLDGGPTTSMIGDVSGDGVVDLVVGLAQQSRLAVFRGKAGGGLFGGMQMDTYGWGFRPMAGDVNMDGAPDLLMLCAQADQVSMYMGRTGGGLHGARNHASGHPTRLLALSAVDLDGDNQAEVLAGSPGSSLLTFLSPVENEFQEIDLTQSHVLDLGRSVRNVICEDLNDDGRLDLIVPVLDGVKLVRNNSTPGFLDFEILPLDPTQALVPASVGPFEVDAEDMNDDGLLDLVISDFYAEKVFLMRATGPDFSYENNPVSVDAIGEPIGVAADDFNGDGIPDVAVSLRAFSMISVFANQGDGTLLHQIDLPVREAPNYLRVADFDRNGRMDLVVSNGNDQSVSVLFAQQGTDFSHVSYSAGHTPTALLARDLNEDGLADILVASLVGADFRIMLGDGQGGFPDLLIFPGLRGVAAARLADVTGDAMPDLLMGSLVSPRVSLYENLSKR